jgi:uncharacterized sodium:solute symporter family permease YidK
MPFFILLLTDIILGFVPQAMGCAACLFAIGNQKLLSRDFLYTSALYSAIAIIVRLVYNFGLIDFGFHTIIIWLIFVVIGIFYNKFPAMKATVSILLSGVLITISEILVCVVLMIAMGKEEFNAVMNNMTTIEGKINKAICGIPANLLFLAIVLVLNLILKRRKQKRDLLNTQSDVNDENA